MGHIREDIIGISMESVLGAGCPEKELSTVVELTNTGENLVIHLRHSAATLCGDF